MKRRRPRRRRKKISMLLIIIGIFITTGIASIKFDQCQKAAASNRLLLEKNEKIQALTEEIRSLELEKEGKLENEIKTK